MSWFTYISASALFLGLYDVCKKHAVRNNRVMPILFIATLCGTLSLVTTNLLRGTLVQNLQCTGAQWVIIFLKTILVASSWIAAYYALHDMPISIVAPIRASSPIWVIIGGIFLFGQIPSLWQTFGIIIVATGYVLFSGIGRAEGFRCHSRGVKMVIASMLLGASSALLDNYLMHECRYPVDTVQLHFSLDLIIILGATWLIQPLCPLLKEDCEKLEWRWSIPLIGILLILADWLFFHAIAAADSQIGILAVIRRTSVFISFFVGSFLFHEQHIRAKFIALLLVATGVVIIRLLG